MHGRRLTGRLLLAVTLFLMGTVVSTVTVTTCDGSYNVHRLSCDYGVIGVKSVLYGRADSDTCSEGRPAGQVSHTSCSQEGTTDVIRTRCDGKSVCELNAKVVHTSDPCSGTYKYLQTNYTCLPAIQVTACESSAAHLYCDEGQIIFVYGADYGRRDQSTCIYRRPESQITNVHCSNPTPKVAERCNGKNRCIINANNAFFGDPCYGTYKYLEVAYVCEYPTNY